MTSIKLLAVASSIAALLAFDALRPHDVTRLWHSGVTAFDTIQSKVKTVLLGHGTPCRWPNTIRLPLACPIQARGTPGTVIFWQH